MAEKGIKFFHTRYRHLSQAGKASFGSKLTSVEDQLTAAELAKTQGWNIHIHAIGDRAIKNTLDVYEKVGKIDGVRSIAHFEICDEDQMKRAVKMGIAVATTPWWADKSSKAELEGAGKKRSKMLDIAGLMKYGVRVSFGADSTGSPERWNPIFNIYTAMIRSTDASKNPKWLLPGNTITIKQAIDAFTINAAKERGHEKEFGSITVGKSADFVIWDKDLMKMAPKDMVTYDEDTGKFIVHVSPLKTYFRGECVFEKR